MSTTETTVRCVQCGRNVSAQLHPYPYCLYCGGHTAGQLEELNGDGDMAPEDMPWLVGIMDVTEEQEITVKLTPQAVVTEVYALACEALQDHSDGRASYNELLETINKIRKLTT